MAQVTVEINGRKFRLACEDGQEPHLRDLAGRLHTQIEDLKGSFGEIGDIRLTVMAALAVMDDLEEAERRIGALKGELDQLTSAGKDMAQEAEDFEARYAQRMAEVARKIEAVATAIDEIGQAQGAQQPTGEGAG